MKKFLVVFMILLCVSVIAAAQENKASDNSDLTGSWNNNVYTNRFFNLKFKLQNGWTKFDTDKIPANQANDTTTLVIANNIETNENIMVICKEAVADMSTEQYMTSMKNKLLALKNIKYEISDLSKEKVAGKEYTTFVATSTVNGMTLTQKYFSREQDKYFLSIIVTTLDGESAIKNIMKSFQ